MKLAILHPAFGTIGGAEMLSMEQANFFKREGQDVGVVCSSFDEQRWRDHLPGIDVELMNDGRGWNDIFISYSRMGKLRWRTRRMGEALKGFDTVIAYNSPANVILGMSRTKARKIWQCNEPSRDLHIREANPRMVKRMADDKGPWLAWLDAASNYFEKIMADHDHSYGLGRSLQARCNFDVEATKQVDLIYAISEYSRENAKRIYGRCRDEVIYPIVRFPEGKRHRAGLDRSGLKVLVHSRLEVLKNIDTVLRGFSLFKKSCPGAQLHVVGDGPKRKGLEGIARDLEGGDAIKFHGFLPDAELQEVYEVCDAFALLPLDEPFGMVFPEAAAKGLLLIGSDHGGPAEILDGGRLGWVVDAFSPEHAAAAMREIFALSDAEVDRRREETDRICRSRFGWDAIGPQLRALLVKQ